MHKTVGITFLTGSRACGKTLMGHLLSELAKDNNIALYDTSFLLKDRAHPRFKDPLGMKVREHLHLMKKGILFPAEIVCAVATERFKALQRVNFNLYHIIMCGSPRDRVQSDHWLQSEYDVRAIHLAVDDQEEMEANIRLRWALDGQVREDEIGDAVKEGWASYENQVRPGLAPWGDRLRRLRRKDSMRSRLELAIDHMNVTQTLKTRMLGRLKHPTHPVCVKVDELDGLRQKPKPVASPKPFVPLYDMSSELPLHSHTVAPELVAARA
jgi:adenylate kinase family enzyme